MKNFKEKLFKYIVKIIISSFAIYITTWLLSGVHIGEPIYINSIILAIVLSLLNSFLKPLFYILTIPLTILSLGFFLLVINTIIILIASRLFEQFIVDGFWWAFGFSIIVSFITTILENIGKNKFSKENYNN